MKGKVSLLQQGSDVTLLNTAGLFQKQVLKKGQYIHPQDPNEKLVIDDELIAEIVKNFDGGTLDALPLVWTHTDDPRNIAGKASKLIATKDGMDAVIDVTDPKAREGITSKTEDGKTLFDAVSPGIIHHYMDKKTGEDQGAVMAHIAIVSHGHQKGMRDWHEPVAQALEGAALGEDGKDFVPLIFNGNIKEGNDSMTPEEMLTALKDAGIDLPGLISENKELTTKVETLVKEGKDQVTSMAELLGLGDGKNKDSDLVTQLAELIAKSKKDGDNLVIPTELTDLIGTLSTNLTDVGKIVKTQDEKIDKMEKATEEREKVAAEEKATTFTDDLALHGKIKAGDKETWHKSFLADSTLAQKQASGLAVVVPVNEKGIAPGEGGTSFAGDEELSAEEVRGHVERLTKLSEEMFSNTSDSLRNSDHRVKEKV